MLDRFDPIVGLAHYSNGTPSYLKGSGGAPPKNAHPVRGPMRPLLYSDPERGSRRSGLSSFDPLPLFGYQPSHNLLFIVPHPFSLDAISTKDVTRTKAPQDSFCAPPLPSSTCSKPHTFKCSFYVDITFRVCAVPILEISNSLF